MDDRITVEYVYEYWDCLACGRKAVRGDARYCPSCGKARDKNLRFYRLTEKEELITNAAEQERLSKGPDWICAFCSTTNNFHDRFCASCGASSDAKKAEPDRVQIHSASKPDQSAQTNNLALRNKQNKPASQKPTRVRRGKASWLKRIKFFDIFFWGSLISLASGVSWCGYKALSCACGYFGSHAVDYVVVDRKWKTTIALEQNKLETLTAWANELPSGAKVLRRERKIRRYDEVQIGTRTETYQDTEDYSTTQVKESSSIERVKTGEREECSTTYESIGSGAARKVTRCKTVPVYSERVVKQSKNVPSTAKRNVTRTREVPVYRKVPVYDTEITYRAWQWSRVRQWESEGSELPTKLPTPVLKAAERGANYRLTPPQTTYTISYKRSTDGSAPESTSEQISEAEFARLKMGDTVQFLYAPYAKRLERKSK